MRQMWAEERNQKEKEKKDRQTVHKVWMYQEGSLWDATHTHTLIFWFEKERRDKREDTDNIKAIPIHSAINQNWFFLFLLYISIWFCLIWSPSLFILWVSSVFVNQAHVGLVVSSLSGVNQFLFSCPSSFDSNHNHNLTAPFSLSLDVLSP